MVAKNDLFQTKGKIGGIPNRSGGFGKRKVHLKVGKGKKEPKGKERQRAKDQRFNLFIWRKHKQKKDGEEGEICRKNTFGDLSGE